MSLLDAIDLDQKLDKATYRARIGQLQSWLFALQRACWKADLATIVVIEGWDASGKGSVISKLTERLEPRGFRLHTIREARTFATQLPWLWRFWQQLPRYGEMAIFDQSWYGRLFIDRVDHGLKKKTWQRRCQDIAHLEQCLTDDRYQMVKCFLHIAKKEKKKRLDALAEDWTTRWKVTDKNWQRHQHYKSYKRVIEATLDQTHRENAPWSVIAATDKRWARWRVMQTVAKALSESLERRSLPVPQQPGAEAETEVKR